VEAGLLIAHEAGAWVTQLEFETAAETRTATVVGTEPRVHDALVALLNELFARYGRRVLRTTPIPLPATG
jgi:hypothetical protein